MSLGAIIRKRNSFLCITRQLKAREMESNLVQNLTLPLTRYMILGINLSSCFSASLSLSKSYRGFVRKKIIYVKCLAWGMTQSRHSNVFIPTHSLPGKYEDFGSWEMLTMSNISVQLNEESVCKQYPQTFICHLNISPD